MERYPLLWLNNIPLSEFLYIYVRDLFIDYSIDRHLGYFYVLVIVNNATINVEVHIFLW